MSEIHHGVQCSVCVPMYALFPGFVNVFLVACKEFVLCEVLLVSNNAFVCVYGKCLGIHPMLDAPFQLSAFTVAFAKGVSGDSSTDRCLLSHWASAHFPLPSLKDILLNINT